MADKGSLGGGAAEPAPASAAGAGAGAGSGASATTTAAAAAVSAAGPSAPPSFPLYTGSVTIRRPNAVTLTPPPAASATASAAQSPSKAPAATGARTPSAAKNRLCRNVIIHGHCKYEGRGCEFVHDPAQLQQPKSSLIMAADGGGDSLSSARASATGSQSQPSPGRGKLSTVVVTAAEFVPSSVPAGSVVFGRQKQQEPEAYPEEFGDDAAEYGQEYAEPGGFGTTTGTAGAGAVAGDSDASEYQDAYGYEYGYYDAQPVHGHYQGTQDMHAMTSSLESMGIGSTMEHGMYQQTSQLDSYFMQQQMTRPQIQMPYEPLMYHLYNSPLPHASNVPPNLQPIHSFFMEDQLREHLQKRNEAAQQVLDPNSEEGQRLPAVVQTYHSLYPLDESKAPSKIFSYPTCVYKAIRTSDGMPYVMRRIEGFRLVNETAMSCIELWRQLRHANLVSVVEAFTTKGFGDSSLVVVFDYHPLATTLTAKYFSRHDAHFTNGLSEPVLWSYICQLTSLIKFVHSQNMAVRVIEPSKILITGKNRLRVNCCGVLDMLMFDSNPSVPHLMQDDLFNFGKLIVALAVGSLPALQNLQKCLEHIERFYSPDLRAVVMYLLSNASPYKSIDEIAKRPAGRQLAREVENGRLFRLVAKLGFVNERPEYELDPTWAETGDTYLLKLFRDYVFHQVDENGAPVLEFSHVLQCLNKLDVGVNEKIMLTSRDEQSCLIVSYHELKKCVDTTFRELVERRRRFG
ncbi:hypothetical protein BC831DRAFT_503639 [Entophlyctis helioformis]|nr:hypothetical protein BC831DRAFT_503639 [Entophlyctis helioformis]